MLHHLIGFWQHAEYFTRFVKFQRHIWMLTPVDFVLLVQRMAHVVTGWEVIPLRTYAASVISCFIRGTSCGYNML